MPLKLHNRIWYPAILPVGIAIVFAIWFRFALHQPEVLLSAIGAVGGFTYFFYRQHIDETRIFKELFIECNGSYAKLNERLNGILGGPGEGDLSDAERELLFSYFNLCAEEYFFYKVGYIDHHVWKAWRSGMNVFFEHSRIRHLWNQECESESYYGFDPDEVGL